MTSNFAVWPQRGTRPQHIQESLHTKEGNTMKAWKNSHVQSTLLLGGLLLALFSALVPGTAAAKMCPQLGCGGISMDPASQTMYVQAGRTYSFNYLLTNNGNVGTTVFLTVQSAHQWPASLQSYMIYLDPFTSKSVQLKVAVPPDNHDCLCFLEDDIVISAGEVAQVTLAKLHLTNSIPVPAAAH